MRAPISYCLFKASDVARTTNSLPISFGSASRATSIRRSSARSTRHCKKSGQMSLSIPRATAGHIAAQVYRRNTPDEFVLLAIGDSGVGIRRSLSTKYQIASDAEALRLALSADVSASGEPGRGQGLPSTAKLVTDLLGRVVVHSGGATMVCRQERRIPVATRRIEGTLVGARIPCRPGEDATR
jgi:hypothetical protein